MLGPLDDTLWHQIAEPFEHVGTSDPRFFDRYWFAVYDPAGQAAVQFTMGSYNNMNVIDGGVVMVRGGTQHNLRASRALRPRFEPEVGPMRVEPTVPLEELRVILAPGDHSIACDLIWRAGWPRTTSGSIRWGWWTAGSPSAMRAWKWTVGGAGETTPGGCVPPWASPSR